MTQYKYTTPCKRGHSGKRFASTGTCVECAKITRIKWRIDHKESFAKQQHEYYETNKPRIRIYQKKHYEENWDRIKKYRDDYYTKNWRKKRATVNAWNKRNPLRLKAMGHTRRSLKKNAVGRFAGSDIQIIFKSQHGECTGCERLFCNELRPTIDHVQPISRGGSNWPSNLQLLCQPCNDSKGTKTMEEWKS